MIKGLMPVRLGTLDLLAKEIQSLCVTMEATCDFDEYAANDPLEFWPLQIAITLTPKDGKRDELIALLKSPAITSLEFSLTSE